MFDISKLIKAKHAARVEAAIAVQDPCEHGEILDCIAYLTLNPNGIFRTELISLELALRKLCFAVTPEVTVDISRTKPCAITALNIRVPDELMEQIWPETKEV